MLPRYKRKIRNLNYLTIDWRGDGAKILRWLSLLGFGFSIPELTGAEVYGNCFVTGNESREVKLLPSLWILQHSPIYEHSTFPIRFLNFTERQLDSAKRSLNQSVLWENFQLCCTGFGLFDLRGWDKICTHVNFLIQIHAQSFFVFTERKI